MDKVFIAVILFLVLSIVILIILISVKISEDEDKKKEKQISKAQTLYSEQSDTINSLGFSITSEVECADYELKVDSRNKQIAILSSQYSSPKILKFPEIIGCDVIKDNSTIASSGVGRAVVGGLLAGGAGAIVGATTRKSKNVVSDLRIYIKTTNIDDPLITLKLIQKQIERNSSQYKKIIEFAEKFQATMDSIMNQNLNRDN